MKLNYCTNCPRWNGTNKICNKCGIGCEEKKVPNKRGGVYYIDKIDCPLPSVTKILQVIAKPGLTYWLKQKVAEAVFADPSISMEGAINAPEAIKNEAASKGGDIHNIIEKSFKGQKISVEDYTSPWKEHIAAYLEFCKTVPHKILRAEHVVYSKEYGFAGQLDALVQIGEKTYILDYKTSKNIYPKEYSMQLSAYKHALLEQGIKIEGMAIVHLKSDNSFSFIEMSDTFEAFLNCLSLYKYLNS